MSAQRRVLERMLLDPTITVHEAEKYAKEAAQAEAALRNEPPDKGKPPAQPHPPEDVPQD